MLTLGISALGCAVESDPHAGHKEQGAATGAACPDWTPLDYATFGQAFLERYCVDCHSTRLGPSEREGAPLGADYDTLEALITSGVEHVDYVAAAGPDSHNHFMPPADFPEQPTAQEREALGEWLACGAP